jgi:hypothetical protein
VRHLVGRAERRVVEPGDARPAIVPEVIGPVQPVIPGGEPGRVRMRDLRAVAGIVPGIGQRPRRPAHVAGGRGEAAERVVAVGNPFAGGGIEPREELGVAEAGEFGRARWAEGGASLVWCI